jgi:hypothetical protein
MGKSTKLISFQAIEETEAFKKLSTVLRKITLSKTNRRQIEHGVNVASNIGFEKWLGQTNFSLSNQEIVKELVELNTSANGI